MATCPECLSKKPFFASRCSQCNEKIGFCRQLYAQWVIFVVTIGSMVCLYTIFVGGFWGAIVLTVIAILLPLVMAFPFLFIYYLFSRKS